MTNIVRYLFFSYINIFVAESVTVSFGERRPADLTDTTISTAVKDWLKQAKHRFLYAIEHTK